MVVGWVWGGDIGLSSHPKDFCSLPCTTDSPNIHYAIREIRNHNDRSKQDM